MNAQEKVLAYVHQHNDGALGMSDEALAGQMVAEGVVIGRTPNSRTFARIARQGSEIVITETTKTTVNKIQNGKLVAVEETAVVEVERISL